MIADELRLIALKTLSNGISANLIVLAATPPPPCYKNIFVRKDLAVKEGFLTTQQKRAGISSDKALADRLGIAVINSPFTLKDVGGAVGLKEYAKNLIEAEKAGYKCKGIFLVGVPGTGKTFFPKCFAGELNRPLIALQLSEIMESPRPIERLNAIFQFLHDRQKEYPNSKYIILIDEIEKMIGNATASEKQMLGRMLTVVNHTIAKAIGLLVSTIDN